MHARTPLVVVVVVANLFVPTSRLYRKFETTVSQMLVTRQRGRRNSEYQKKKKYLDGSNLFCERFIISSILSITYLHIERSSPVYRFFYRVTFYKRSNKNYY